MNDYDEARIEEIEADKVKFLKIADELAAWLSVNRIDRSDDDKKYFDPEYQTADMKAEILAVLDKEIEFIREDMPADYTKLGRG
ncbi:MAG: hypothetical protein COB09_17000 [Thalassobium sp.]|nr:MAG: hypothetical protein COB09_17000 [Thalassobium sp.]